MNITFFSYLMSLLFFHLFGILIFLLFRSKKLLLLLNIYPFLISSLLCFFRLIFNFEIPQAMILHSKHMLPLLLKIISVKPFPLFASLSGITVGHILIWIWGSGIGISVAKLLKDNMNFRKQLSLEECEDKKDVGAIFAAVCSNHRVTIKSVNSAFIHTPMIVGFFKPVIYLPQKPMSDKELYYILLHEWKHYIYKDLWLKLLIEIICVIYWWNPLIYLFKWDFNNVLEIKNDYLVTKNMDTNERVEYLETILNVIKLYQGKKETEKKTKQIDFCFVSNINNLILKQRFHFIMNPEKQNYDQKLLSFCICFFMVLMFYSSFFFIVQPYMEPQAANPVIYDITPSNSYLIQDKNCEYNLYIDGQYIDTIYDITKEPFSQLPIRKEE